MTDFDRRLSQELKRVRDQHAASDLCLRAEMLRRGKRRRTLRMAGTAAGIIAVVVLAATAVPLLSDEAAPGPAGPPPTATTGPTPVPAEAFAIWPEVTPAAAEAVCGSNAPEWRADDVQVTTRFAREVLGWADPTPPEVIRIGKSGVRGLVVGRSQDEPGVQVEVSVAPTLFGMGCLSVIGVTPVGDAGPTGVSVSARGGVVDLAWNQGGAASADAIVGYGTLEQVQENTAPPCHFLFAARPNEPGYFLVLLKDDTGEVMSAAGSPLPAGDFAAG